MKFRLYSGYSYITCLVLLIPILYYRYGITGKDLPVFGIPVLMWNPYLEEQVSFHIHPQRDYKPFFLSGSPQSDLVTLTRAEEDIKRLTSTKDTTNGIVFELGIKSTLQNYIDVLDICAKEGPGMFVPHDSKVWVYNLSAREHKEAEKNILEKFGPPRDCE